MHFVGGKGGVGKTTCAAAIALSHAAARHRTLLISTDPASSLADALRQPVTRAPRPVHGAPRLRAVDIDAPHALSRWLEKRRPVLARIALRGTWLDEEDVSRLLRLTLPGIDEIAALIEISRHLRSGRYDALIVDTAPTGHTLRMLATPQTLGAIARVFDHMQAKHRVVAEALRGSWQPDAADALIDELGRDARELAAILRDPARVRISWVTLPEPMSVAETLDALTSLDASGIRVTQVIANRVTDPPSAPCRWCNSRRALEGRALVPLRRAYPRVPAAVVSARPEEPRGPRALLEIARQIDQQRRWAPETRRVLRVRAAGVPVPGKRAFASLDFIVGGDVRFLMFGGKGGVGKTTCAAAAALAIARQYPNTDVLLLSTDPAHSLGDALGERLSDEPRRLKGGPRNLHVRELDAARGFEEVRRRYGEAIDAMFDRLSRGSSWFDASHERRVMRDLIDLAPPGIDELAAIIEVTDVLTMERQDSHQLLVIDTAPSGHALRLLEMPSLVQDWSKALMSILLKYEPVVGVGDLGPILLRLARGTRALRELLGDATRTRFVPVTRPALLPRVETLRLLTRLRALKINVSAVVVNAVGAGTCPRCRETERIERRQIAALRRELQRNGSIRVIVAPSTTPPPHGLRPLENWLRDWSAL